MTRDQNGTWEMESNDNFEGYMKALGKGDAGGGREGRDAGGGREGRWKRERGDSFVRTVVWSL